MGLKFCAKQEGAFIMAGKLYNVGKIVNTHGIRGELKILSQTDFPDLRFEKGSKLIFLEPESGRTVHAQVEGSREHKGMFITRFREWDNINQVEQYKGWQVKVDEDSLAELEEDEYYYHEIIGCTVLTTDGEKLGEISEILTPGANHVWVVKRPKGKDLLLPVIDPVIKQVDVASKQVIVELMEGLLE
jgi:16S rRNA processing protein RimM